MKAVLLDIGAGTVDFLLYEDGMKLENSVKMVLPSPQKGYAENVREITKSQTSLFINGYTIGGGSLTQAVKSHINKGHKVYMSPQAAYSIRNNIDEVKTIGVEIVEDKPPECVTITLDEVKLESYESMLNQFDKTLKDSDICAVSVKDHGAPPTNMSNREFRIKKFREVLKKDSSFNGFLYKKKEIPDYFYRMKSATLAVEDTLRDAEIYTMDTSVSALAGCLMDPRIQGREPALLVNIGNGHTIAAVISENMIQCFFEHHTSLLNQTKLNTLLRQLCDGNVTHESIYEDGGHGVIYSGDVVGFSNIGVIAVTGPKRRLLKGTNFEYLEATPGGDVIMTGTLGLLYNLKDSF